MWQPLLYIASTMFLIFRTIPGLNCSQHVLNFCTNLRLDVLINIILIKKSVLPGDFFKNSRCLICGPIEIDETQLQPAQILSVGYQHTTRSGCSISLGNRISIAISTNSKSIAIVYSRWHLVLEATFFSSSRREKERTECVFVSNTDNTCRQIWGRFISHGGSVAKVSIRSYLHFQ